MSDTQATTTLGGESAIIAKAIPGQEHPDQPVATQPDPAGPAPAPQLERYAQQEIRVAAVLNGGVSLAVWMSGVTLELHHLALSSQRLGPWTTYRRVLDVLGAVARVDVIAGTSAGGLNGAFLALAQAHRRDLSLLRDLWTDSGSLEALMRAGNTANPPSLLQGDGYFLPEIAKALQKTVSDQENPALAPDGYRYGIELILTGTLWAGRATLFTDDMGVGITERDYDATFHFTRSGADARGNLDNIEPGDPDNVVPQLASAARCTSSFPAAFEPHEVKVDAGLAGRLTWPSSAGTANFSETQYVMDGGILLNKPIRPALEAIYKQTGDRQVRRILAYVVPDPGEPKPAAAATTAAAPIGPAPVASDVLLSVITRLRSTDSVARELAEIRDRNATVRDRRRMRAQLCAAMAQAGGELSGALWPAYQNERTSSAASRIATLVAAGQAPGPHAWSERELTDALARYAAGQPIGFSFVPSGDIGPALAQQGQDWHWGQTTVSRLGDMTVDLLKRAVWLAELNTELQEKCVDCRAELAPILDRIRADRANVDSFWAGAATGIPPRSVSAPPPGTSRPVTNQPATNVSALDEWISQIVPRWDSVPLPGAASASVAPGDRRAWLHEQAGALAKVVFDCRGDINAVLQAPNVLVDPDGTEKDALYAMFRWLLGAAAGDQLTEDDVLERMLRLDVVQFATAGAVAQVEQAVELVQVSCSRPDEITGMQIHHFGAFYRAPWRVNDWIEGRIDGAKQVMRFILSPERLRQRGLNQDPNNWYEVLRATAIADGDQDADFLEQQWNRDAGEYRREITLAADPASPATALDKLAGALALPLQLRALREDLPALAGAIRDELDDAMESSKVWLANYDAALKAAPNPAPGEAETSTLTAQQLWELREGMTAIGRQRIAADIGSDTFARTVSQAATVTAGTLGSTPKIGKLKPVAYTLKTLRGYTAMVWTMVTYLTKGSAFGTRVVALAAAAGGALLAVAVLVPGAPLALALTGVLLLLSGATAAGLLTKGARWFAFRMAAAGLLVAAALAYLIWRDVAVHGWKNSSVASTLIKGGVGLVIVLLGSYIAQARPSKKETVGIAVVIAAALAALFIFHPWNR